MSMMNGHDELLKSYFYRLLEGESLKSVQEDLFREFESVDPKDVLKAEEHLMIAGVPTEEVQKISQWYPKLFYGKLKSEITDEDENIFSEGHPYTVMKNENEFLSKRLQEAKEKLRESDEKEVKEIVKDLRNIAFHYTKKSDLFYTLLKKDYRFLTPSSVMWGVDDDIRDGLRILQKKNKGLKETKEKLFNLIEKAEDVIYTERYILAPICAEQFSQIDWMRIYYELDAYEYLLGDNYPVWKDAEAKREDLKTVGGKLAYEIDGFEEVVKPTVYVTIGSGKMTPQQIDAIFKTIPMEFTFVDEKNTNRYFDSGDEKIFKRPDMAIGRDMFSCHPPKLLPTVRDIILDFRTGKRDQVNVWMEYKGEPVCVMYLAVKDEEGHYLGTLECVQKLGFAYDRFEKIKNKRSRKK